MSRVSCINCGEEDDVRSMTVCSTCDGYICARCASLQGGQCGRCRQSSFKNSEPL